MPRQPDLDDEEPIGPAPHGREASLRTRLLAVLVLVGVLYGVLTFAQVWWASASVSALDLDPTADGGRAPAAIVLGAAQYNGEPSPVLRSRLDHAAALYVDDRVDIVTVTGGGREGDRTTEAKASYDYLRDVAGIPDDRLRLEVDGTSTYEELAAAARFLRNEGITEVILVTDPYHARRVQLVADEVGLDATVSTTDAGAPFGRLIRETGAVAVGQIISFRRLERLVD